MEDWNKNVKLVKILNDDHEKKFIAVEGELAEKSAVLVLEKTPFQFDEVTRLLKENEQTFRTDFINDVYHKYTVQARSTCNDVSLAFIYPANDLHIKKYSKKEFLLIHETQQRYETIVRPYIEQNQLNAQWVYNIIDGKSERERILLDTEQFIILPDIMWDGKAIESLHILGLVKTHNIHSIRDLRSEHIPMLESVLEKAYNFISSKYGISTKSIRAFFHYPPTFYHLHIHFTTLQNQSCGCQIERAHLVENVIDHLKLQNNYYQTKTLYYKVAISDPLYKLLEKDNENNNDQR